MKLTHTILPLALVSTLASGALVAQENPFAMQALGQGYLHLVDAKPVEGKCGASRAEETTSKSAEGKCGASQSSDKAKEGKCGEGKCGANKTSAKAQEGKCGGAM